MADSEHTIRPRRTKRATAERACENCGTLFHAPLSEVKQGHGRFCSRSCAATAHLLKRHRERPQVGDANPKWRGGRSQTPYVYKKAQRAKFPERDAARRTVYLAVRRGELVRPSACERCGDTCRPHAHHADYARPLGVEWLCRACHRKHHRSVAGPTKCPTTLPFSGVKAATASDWCGRRDSNSHPVARTSS